MQSDKDFLNYHNNKCLWMLVTISAADGLNHSITQTNNDKTIESSLIIFTQSSDYDNLAA